MPMNSKNFGQRVGRALAFLAGQVLLVFVIALLAGKVVPVESESVSDLRFAIFAVSVYYLGFLVGPIMLIVLIVFDNRAWIRTVSALLPIGFGGVSYVATIYVQEAGGGSLLPEGALLGAGWLIAAVALLLAYNWLFGVMERRVWC